MTFIVEIAPPGLGNLCQVLHSGSVVRAAYSYFITNKVTRTLLRCVFLTRLISWMVFIQRKVKSYFSSAN